MRDFVYRPGLFLTYFQTSRGMTGLTVLLQPKVRATMQRASDDRTPAIAAAESELIKANVLRKIPDSLPQSERFIEHQYMRMYANMVRQVMEYDDYRYLDCDPAPTKGCECYKTGALYERICESWWAHGFATTKVA
jgi:hypothetical protein